MDQQGKASLLPPFFHDLSDVYDVVLPSPHETVLLNSITGAPKSDLYTISIKVGSYKSDEIKISTKNRILTVSGDHSSVTKYGFEKCEFFRQYLLPTNVLTNTIRFHITSDGILEINAKKNENVRYSYQDKSTNTSLHLIIDILDYEPNEVKVSLHGSVIIVQASSDDKQKGDKDTKSFKKIIALYPDVDLSTLKCVRTNDGYLEIRAVRNQKLLDDGAKHIPIDNSHIIKK